MFETASTRDRDRRTAALAVGTLVLVAGLAAVGMVGAAAAAGSAAAPGPDHPTVGTAIQDETPEEEEYVAPVPEPGDEYFEAAADDGSWVSYDNPRDEYRSPYLGDGSGKICVTLLNADGEVIVGETVPNTTVTIPTGDAVEWHSHADPMTVELPLTEHYDRPLDSDQFGTSPDYAQGDGYLDAHCIEIHGPAEDETIEYGEVEIDGEHADRLDLVGYIEQENEAWETDVDPVDDAVSYASTGGQWTYEPNASHGQVVAVLQLEGDGDDEGSSPGASTAGANVGGDDDDENPSPMPGPGAGLVVVAGAIALAIGAIAARRSDE